MARKNRFSAIALAAVIAGFAAIPLHAAEPIKIDASSDAAVEQSMRSMLAESNTQEKQQLLIAVLKLNLVGVSGAREMVANPELQNLSAARIKQRIAGMTAHEIIALADRTPTQIKTVEVLQSK
jgi:hypothetical protein